MLYETPSTFIYYGIFISFYACGDDELKEIYNPNLLRSTSIDDSSLHLAFPGHCGNKDRSKNYRVIEKVRATLVLIVS